MSVSGARWAYFAGGAYLLEGLLFLAGEGELRLIVSLRGLFPAAFPGIDKARSPDGATGVVLEVTEEY